MSTLNINKEGVRNFIKKRYYEDECDIISELAGCAPGKATEIDYTIINNILIQTINDGGLTEEDLQRLSEYFNSGNNGHSEHGVGSRTAAVQLTKESNDETGKFYILDIEKGIVFDINGPEMIYERLKDKEVFDLNKRYPSDMNHFTKWIIPVPNKFNEESIINKIKNDLKFRYCMLILNKQITIKFKDEELTLENQAFEPVTK